MSTRARATSMRAIRHGARKLTARARAVRALLSTNTKGRIPALWSDAGWFRDRARTQPWVYPADLEQQVQWVDDLTGQPRGWALGPDRITNGDFSVDANWIKGTGWSISGGAAVANAATGNLSQNNVAPNPAGKIYRVSLTIVSRSAGSIVPQISGSSVTLSSPGTYSFYLSPTSGTDATLYIPAVNFTGTIDNVTVQEVILDQSWLGPELVTNGGFGTDTDWTKGTGWSIGSGVASKSAGTASTLSQSESLTAGRVYQLTYTLTRTAGSLTPQFTGGTTVSGTARSADGTYTDCIAAVSGNNALAFSADASFAGTVDIVSLREIPGNPSVSPSAGNGPTPTARVNLLQRTEDVSSAAWVKTSATVSGTDTVTANSSTSGRISQSFAGQPVAAGWRICLEMKQGTAARNRVLLRDLTNNSNFIQATDITWTAGVPVVSGITAGSWAAPVDVGGGWYRFSATGAGPSGSTPTIDLQLFPDPLNGTGSVQIRRTDLRLAVYDSLNLPAYQRVNDGSAGVFDYDHVGFPVRLVRGAANRGLMTLGTLDLTGTDAVNAGMWVVKTSDAGAATILETSANASSTAGAILLSAPDSAAANVGFSSRGSVQATVNQAGHAAPKLLASLGSAKISTDSLSLAVNGGTPATSSSDQGTGNYGNHRLYEGGRSLDSSPSLSFTGEWLPGFVVDANGVPADLAAEVLREYAAAVNFYY